MDCVILGTSPGAEQLALSVCRDLKFNVVIVPPNLTRDHWNASYFRNNWVMKLLKPTHVLAFHECIDNSLSTAQYLKLAERAKVPHVLYKK